MPTASGTCGNVIVASGGRMRSTPGSSDNCCGSRVPSPKPDVRLGSVTKPANNAAVFARASSASCSWSICRMVCSTGASHDEPAHLPRHFLLENMQHVLGQKPDGCPLHRRDYLIGRARVHVIGDATARPIKFHARDDALQIFDLSRERRIELLRATATPAAARRAAS